MMVVSHKGYLNLRSELPYGGEKREEMINPELTDDVREKIESEKWYQNPHTEVITENLITGLLKNTGVHKKNGGN